LLRELKWKAIKLMNIRLFAIDGTF
jgi:hypothetical protein